MKRFMKVTNLLWRGGAPSLKEVKKLKDRGIKRIVSLDAEEGKRIDRLCKILNIEHFTFPLTDKLSSVNEILNTDLNDLLNTVPTFIHCAAGKDRTGFVVALFKVKILGESPDYAIKEAKKIGMGVFVPKSFRKTIKYYENILKSFASIVDSIVDKNDTHEWRRDSVLEDVFEHTFAPYLDETQTYPANIYSPLSEQDVVRNNGGKQEQTNEGYGEGDEHHFPLNGVFDNAGGVEGVGPTLNSGGFIYI